MKKLSLDMETLVVESFDTTTLRNAETGTVRAHFDELDRDIGIVTIGRDRTFDVSCYCQTENCVSRVTCYSCESCRTCTICIPV